MSKELPRMNIAQLEELLNETQDGEVEVKPDGKVVRLTNAELLEKNLELERARNAGLLRTINELRAKLKSIRELLDEHAG